MGSVTTSAPTFAAPGADWGTPAFLETREGDPSFPQLAIDSSGNALAVWSQHDGTHFSIWSNRYTAGSSWESRVPIEADEAGNAFIPQIAIDANGNALAIWPRCDGICELWSNRYTAGSGVWGTAAPIDLGPDSGVISSGAQLAIDPSGNALAVWAESMPATQTIRVRGAGTPPATVGAQARISRPPRGSSGIRKLQ